MAAKAGYSTRNSARTPDIPEPLLHHLGREDALGIASAAPAPTRATALAHLSRKSQSQGCTPRFPGVYQEVEAKMREPGSESRSGLDS